MQMASSTMMPASSRFHYQNEPEMQEFVKKTNSEVESNIAKSSRENIKFLNSSPYVGPGKFYSIIAYKTAINISEFDRLKTENNEINKKIGDFFPGICEFSDTIMYYATNDEIVNRKLGNSYRFIMSCPGKQ